MINIKACWIATLNPKDETLMKSPFPHPKSISPLIPSVGDRIAVIDNIVEYGRVAVLAGRQGRVVARTCGVYTVQFDHEIKLPNARVRHVFQEAITVLRRRLPGVTKAAA